MTIAMIIPDDNLTGITPGVKNLPEICVDYLSHDWQKEDDIWTSWKAMSKQKKEIANGVRLENASWRTWAKQKYHLRTVNPEKINWLKDNDVTWLYGPFHTEDKFHLMKTSSQSLPPLSDSNDTDYVNYVNDIHSSPTSLVSPALPISSDPCTPQMLTSTSKSKSCLKKKKISEILRPKSCATNTISEKNQYDINITNYYKDIISTTAPSIIPTTSMIINNNNCGDGDLGSDCETASTCSTISAPTTPIAGPTKSILLPIERESNQHNHHIRFNDQVEQCIAIDSYDCEEEEEDKDDKENSIDNNNKKIMKKKKDCFTICKIAPTKLKPGYSTNNKNDNGNDGYFNYDYDYDYDCNYDNAFSSTNHNKNDKNNAASSSSTPSTTTSSSSNKTQPKFPWMDDDDDDLDIDDLDIFDFDSSPPSSLSSSYNSTSTIQPIPFCCSQSPPRIISSTSSSGNINDIAQTEDQEEEEEEDSGLVDKAVNIATSVGVIVQWWVFNR